MFYAVHIHYVYLQYAWVENLEQGSKASQITLHILHVSHIWPPSFLISSAGWLIEGDFFHVHLSLKTVL